MNTKHFPNQELNFPEWQKELIDIRLESIENNPERIHPIENLMQELNELED